MATSIFINGSEHALSVGSTISLPTGSIPLKPITKEEYDALSEEEKNSETAWLVSNAEDEDGSGNVGGGGSGEVYSEEETIIGTFLGKKLYRKVLTGRSDSIAMTTTIANISALNIETVVSMTGMVTNAIGQKLQIPALLSSGNGYFIVDNANTVLEFFVTSDGLKDSPVTCYLEYTKSTDIYVPPLDPPPQ